MEPLVNDRWRATFTVDELGRYRYTAVAWIDHFGTWVRDLGRRVAAGQDVATDLLIGAGFVEAAAARATGPDAARLAALAATIRAGGKDAGPAAASAELASLMHAHAERASRPGSTRSSPSSSTASWPASGPGTSSSRARAATEPAVTARSRDVEARLPEIAAMGFDVLYLPPIHPIGRTLPQGPEQHHRRRSGRPRQPVGDRRRRGRPHGGPPGARHARGLPAPRRRGRASTGSRSRSTSPSSAPPTIRT